ncbi:AsnC family transcriptional regulator [Paeniroseomonas aquatica]
MALQLDSIDRAILAALQEDATLSIAAVADRAGLSPSPAGAASAGWRRRR